VLFSVYALCWLLSSVLFYHCFWGKGRESDWPQWKIFHLRLYFVRLEMTFCFQCQACDLWSLPPLLACHFTGSRRSPCVYTSPPVQGMHVLLTYLLTYARVYACVCRQLFTCGKKTETKPAAEGEEEMSANAVIRREYVKLGKMT